MSEENKPLVTAELYDKYHDEFPDLKVGDPLPQVIIDLEAEEAKAAADEKARKDAEDAAAAKSEEDRKAAAAKAAVPTTPVTPKLSYRGLLIVSSGFRTVENTKYRHIRCSDGTEYDLTEKEYKEQVIAYKPAK